MGKRLPALYSEAGNDCGSGIACCSGKCKHTHIISTSTACCVLNTTYNAMLVTKHVTIVFATVQL